MVRRQGAPFRGQFGRPQIAQLTRMDMSPQTQLCGGAHQAIDLRDGKCDVFAKRIHSVHQTVGRERLQPRAADLSDEVIPVCNATIGQRVQSEESFFDADGQPIAELARHFE